MSNSKNSFIRHFPGYYLASFLAGRDLLESRMISRQPNNFLRGTLGLIPGGEALYRKLIETGAIEEAADWLEDQTEDLEKKHENRSDRGSIEEKK